MLSPTFAKGVSMTKCSGGLGRDHLYMHSPCNLFTKDYTKVFYMIYEGNVLFIQC